MEGGGSSFLNSIKPEGHASELMHVDLIGAGNYGKSSNLENCAYLLNGEGPYIRLINASFILHAKGSLEG